MQWPVSDNVLIAMNKPTGYECSLKPSAHPSVMNLLPGPLRTRGVQPVGRLDWDTTGLLLFTDNGSLLHRLTHPKKHVNKVYRATLSHPAANGTCEKLLSGVVLDDDPKPVFAKAAELMAPDVLMLTISQGEISSGQTHGSGMRQPCRCTPSNKSRCLRTACQFEVWRVVLASRP